MDKGNRVCILEMSFNGGKEDSHIYICKETKKMYICEKSGKRFKKEEIGIVKDFYLRRSVGFYHNIAICFPKDKELVLEKMIKRMNDDIIKDRTLIHEKYVKLWGVIMSQGVVLPGIYLLIGNGETPEDVVFEVEDRREIGSEQSEQIIVKKEMVTGGFLQGEPFVSMRLWTGGIKMIRLSEEVKKIINDAKISQEGDSNEKIHSSM